ncbi:thioredoxin family protein [Novibacillus thermophilus]|uniref:Thioredoxin family protein n=1 Tax=Novibacillus thermophilus TaxID=1471761 RepID=A0A1U9KB83_9BACL|nr:thioredoxin family protein [Novibacillus thermophilus]AQS57253.1 thioredoxin family protein [Novibacillus thermophilus]
MTLNDWFKKGMTIEQYIDSMAVNKEEMLQIYDNFQLSPDDRAFFETLKEKNWRVIVLTADWCGDAMLCVPVFMRISEAASIEMSLLIRDDNLELMDQYLTNGKSRSIPIFIFIDQDGNEQAVWGPRAPEVQQLIDDMRNSLPDKEDPSFEAKQKEMYRNFKQRLLSDRSLWKAVSHSFRERLS